MDDPRKPAARKPAAVWSLILVLTLAAAACGGEVDETTPPDDQDVIADPNATANTDPGDDVVPTDPEAPNTYDDPRGGLFAEFQAGYDRGDHPFQQAGAVCLPHPAVADRVDTDPGITADAISVVHVRARLEDAADLGFAVPVGDTASMFDTFVGYINETCGGIRGRRLDLHTIEVPILGQTVEEEKNAACIEAVEDHKAVITMNSTSFGGSATLCFVEEHEAAFIVTEGESLEWLRRGEGRLVSMSNATEESLTFLVDHLLESGALEGAVVGVAAPDAPGQPEPIQDGLVQPLRDAGIEVVHDVIGCGGGTICTGGVGESVTNMLNSGITVFFNVLNILSAPVYIAEMAAQGFEPGDVKFYASDFNSQTAELVAGQITNNPAAGALYNGAIMVEGRTAGEYRIPDYSPNIWEQTCNDIYSEHNPEGNHHEWHEQGGDSAFSMVAEVCSILRVAARALYNAGDNPTVADVHETLRNLGPVEQGSLTPASVTPGKPQAPDVVQSLTFEFPCDHPYPFKMPNGNKVCVTGNEDWWPAPRG